MKEQKNRRKFITGSLEALAGASLLGHLASCAGTTDEGETIKVLSTNGKVYEIPKSEAKSVPGEKIYHEREGVPGRRFVMVIDLARCQNARKCVSSCNKHHAIGPPSEWLKIYSMQDSEESAPYWQPVLCQHCDKPPCVKVCPVDATFKRRDGLVLIDNDRCIGCRFCMAACPYSTRVFNWSNPESGTDSLNAYNPIETSIPHEQGTVEKCDFCPDMVTRGELPHCVTACPNSVFYFGDQLEDVVTNGSETVRLSELLKSRAGYRMMEDLGTEPRVYYLPPVDRLENYEEGLENYDPFLEKEDETG